MKKLVILMAAALLLGSGPSAGAQEAVSVEVIKMDGVSVVKLTSEENLYRGSSEAKYVLAGSEKLGEYLVLPQSLTLIEKEAFMNIKAKKVEISEHVVQIEERAFANCRDLRQIVIPESVLIIDDHALEGCENVTVYGKRGTEAERFAKAAGFAFKDAGEEDLWPASPVIRDEPPIELPLVPAK